MRAKIQLKEIKIQLIWFLGMNLEFFALSVLEVESFYAIGYVFPTQKKCFLFSFLLYFICFLKPIDTIIHYPIDNLSPTTLHHLTYIFHHPSKTQ